MQSDLKRKTIICAVWNGVEQLGRQIVQFAIGVVLARLLNPSDFGMFAIVFMIINLCNVIINSGFMQALIRKDNLDDDDCSTVFYFTLLISLILYVLFFVLSPFIAIFFQDDSLKLYIRVATCVLFLSPVNIITTSLLNRNMDFKTPAIVILISSIASGALGVFMAVVGCGIWSLIFQNMLFTILFTVGLMFFTRWKLVKGFSKQSFRGMFSYGSKLLLSDVIDFAFRNIYTIVIGKIFSTTVLGYYNRANSFPSVINNIFYSVVNKVFFVTLSKVQGDKKVLKEYFKKTFMFLSFILFPTMMIFAMISRSFVLVFLTEKWIVIDIYIKVLCLSLLLYSFAKINSTVLKVLGDSNKYLRIEIFNKIIVVLLLVITCRFDMLTVLLGAVASNFVTYVLCCFSTQKHIGYTVKQQFVDLLQPMIVTLLTMTFLFFFQKTVESSLVDIIITPIAGVAIYLAISMMMQKSQVAELKRIILMIK